MECVTFKLVEFDMKMEGVKSNLVILQCDKKDLPYFLSRQLVLFLQLVLRVPFNDKIKCQQKSRNSWEKKNNLKNQPYKELRWGRRVWNNIGQIGPIFLSLGILIYYNYFRLFLY